ncbi:hypothetical protein [Pseudorhodoplanes sinuspersici]|uniref:Uncharacterized protein n=1 Tax=Pseudorhodoplanes sinuspersici TaxID=1235591 RepID=A0A1W6ZWX7_9HYPH|nr:hypothetical protein [Pseudorhodoplanes sinuspersici]ARQ01909.1 hypothetical protein CAK95_24525 [Pseudorhodoplanes sinuspersici]RKE73678.1 hypothetical protein DFP91_1573 [Pseudorhodoplanes sinuspersici]
MTLRIGFPAECIDAAPMHGDDPTGLVLGREYIITALNDFVDEFGAYGVRVIGAKAPSQSGFFRSSRFRPVEALGVSEACDDGLQLEEIL